MSVRSALLAGLLLVSACGANDTAANAQSTELTDEAFEEQLRRVLTERPEIILEALEVYRTRLEQESEAALQASVDAALPALVAAETGNAIGASAEDAELVIVEFFDYHCGFCREAVADVLGRSEKNDKLRVVFQELPILRQESRDAALVSLAAGEIGPSVYRSVHAELMKTSGLLDEKAIDRALRRAGVKSADIDMVLSEKEGELSSRLDRSLDLARSIGIEGTPFFVILDPKDDTYEIVSGYRAEVLDQAIKTVAGS